MRASAVINAVSALERPKKVPHPHPAEGAAAL